MFPVPQQAAGLVAGFEGFRAAPYLCPAGVWTVGFGSTRDGAGHPVTAETPNVTRASATALLERDLGASAQELATVCHVALNDAQASALVSLIYNIGGGAFAGSTLLKKLNAKDYDAAAAQFSVWNRGGGQVLPGLVARRAAEAKLFRTASRTPWPAKGA